MHFGIFTFHRKGYGMAQKKALLIDISRCVGCNACQDACQGQNKLPELSGGETGKLSDKAYTALREYDGVHVRQLCRHCHEPACKSVCLASAFHQTPEGAVLYNGDKCIGCRNCIQACPFYIPKYEWKSNEYERDGEKHGWKGTFPRVKKCVLCSERIANGQAPSCADACHEQLGDESATTFGDYEEMVAEAKRRISEDPDGYVQRIYGLTEVGGTTVLFLSAVPFEQLGFDTKLEDGTTPAGFDAKVHDDAFPPLTGKALSKVPNVVAIGAALLGGVWWITNRRHEVEKHESHSNDSHN
jgi:formate dehydrogenase iron-sulfur subunit